MKRIAVPNRYFGVFQDGEIKTRGIETRRHDTPEFIRETQMQILEILAKAPNASRLVECLPEIRKLVHGRQAILRSGSIPLEKLIVHQTVSRTLEEFRSPSPVALAMRQLQGAGKTLRPGQSVRLLYTLGAGRATAWDLPEPPRPAHCQSPALSPPASSRCGYRDGTHHGHGCLMAYAGKAAYARNVSQ
ncbi:MAG: hypothetical protein M0C28_34790 [Candidatus Moduliflexus flocculans]|nr:hypothetical protein [Candidatus Moduliflexus flocculans]